MTKQEYTLTIYTENKVGIIGRIVILFSRKKINIESISGSPSEVAGIFRFTILINESEEVVRKVCRQLEKQVDILKAYFNTNSEIVWQEQALFKVATEKVTEGADVERLARIYGARAVVIRNDYTVFETSGHTEDIDKLTEALANFGLIEFVRSGRIAIIKNSEGFHKKLKEFEREEPAPEVKENEFLDKQDKVFTM
ncbi:acetolactate synthase small subunit [Albibacterium indicum]|uniref:acetolactate synthase small subunit n=1 Tax=Albibacterium indicum TaxID=2292082 RepID=UPI000E4F6B96|nr:acetolactate synthase small subunit [Pedobacter indicus]